MRAGDGEEAYRAGEAMLREGHIEAEYLPASGASFGVFGAPFSSMLDNSNAYSTPTTGGPGDCVTTLSFDVELGDLAGYSGGTVLSGSAPDDEVETIRCAAGVPHKHTRHS